MASYLAISRVERGEDCVELFPVLVISEKGVRVSLLWWVANCQVYLVRYKFKKCDLRWN